MYLQLLNYNHNIKSANYKELHKESKGWIYSTVIKECKTFTCKWKMKD